MDAMTLRCMAGVWGIIRARKYSRTFLVRHIFLTDHPIVSTSGGTRSEEFMEDKGTGLPHYSSRWWNKRFAQREMATNQLPQFGNSYLVFPRKEK